MTNGNRGWAAVVVAAILTMLAASLAPAQSFKTLVNLGEGPVLGPLVQGPDGNLYGAGGAGPNGTIFKMSPTGTLSTLYTFTGGADGSAPNGLVLGSDGNFYGTTGGGGSYNTGTIFKITQGGILTTLYSFCGYDCPDGFVPSGNLVQARDGNFYGTTFYGGFGDCYSSGEIIGCGTAFRISPQGAFTSIHSFGAAANDGVWPLFGMLLGLNGNLYGTTRAGGANGYGTAFAMSLDGNENTIYSFCALPNCVDGEAPGGMVQGPDGNFYGLMGIGGNDALGTVYKLTSGGTLTTLHSFGGTDGEYPGPWLVLASDGTFYGTTTLGGSNDTCSGPGYEGCGTIFRITNEGTLTTLHSFDGSDGEEPLNALVQATSGNFYGSTRLGGTGVWGTIFSLGTGLKPFVETNPIAGAVGSLVTILGNHLTGTTSVTFNGTPATFTVVSATAISTAVPSGAKTGKVQVTTPGGTLTSNVNFQVLP